MELLMWLAMITKTGHIAQLYKLALPRTGGSLSVKAASALSLKNLKLQNTRLSQTYPLKFQRQVCMI